MIQLKRISDFNADTDEGKLLVAAIAILTSIDKEDIKSNKWGGMVSPDTALEQIQDLANKIYFEQEYKIYLHQKERDNKIQNILHYC